MTIINPLPYECVPVPSATPDTTPDIWGVYPENAMLRHQIEKNEELLDTFIKTIASQQHEIRTLNDRIGFNDVMHKNQFHAINTFFKWVMEHYDLDKQDDIWEMLDGMFQDGLLQDPRRRTFRVQVRKQEVQEYNIEFPWDTTEERATEIVNGCVQMGDLTCNSFQDISTMNDVPVTITMHSNQGTEYTVWNRGQINNMESPW